MNNSSSTVTVIAANVHIFYQLIAFGSTAAIANAFLLITFFSNCNLLKKCSSTFGLAVADFINGLALLVSGSIRLAYFNLNVYGLMVHPFECMTKNAVVLYIIGNQLPSLMLLVIAVERLVAVQFYKWFYKSYSHKRAWLVTFSAMTFSLMSVLIAYLLVYFRPESTRITNDCQTPGALGPTSGYNVYNYLLPVVCGTVAAATTVVSMFILVHRKKRLLVQQNSQYRKVNKNEWQMTKVMTMVAVLDFILVVVPNIFVFIRSVFFISVIPNFVYYSLQVICCRSALNIVIYMVFNHNFRKDVLDTFGFKFIQPANNNLVTPFSNSAV